MFPVSIRTLALAGIALVVIGASSSVGYRLGRAAGDREVAKMYRAGLDVVRKREELIARNLEVYREDLAAVAARKPKRVYLCPDDGVPKAASRVADSGARGADRGADGTDLGSHDYGPELRAARDALIRCNALIATLQ